MNGSRQPDAATDAGELPSAKLQFFLVRLIPAGAVCWVGSIHRIRHPDTDLPVQRGDRVVVHNAQGEWLAEVLNTAGPSDRPAEGASGELLRVATANDERATAVAVDKARTLYDATLRDRIASDVTVVATEVSLDHRVGVVRMLGAADDRFGPAAVRLASVVELQRVQWIDVSKNQEAQTKHVSADRGEMAVRECTPEEADDAAFWQRMRQVVNDAVPLGASHRIAVGNRGLYQQKLRGVGRLSPNGEQVPASASGQRCWMIRVRTAAGGMTANQLEKLCGIARRFGDGSLRLTTRQAIQLHGVALGSAPEVMRQLQDAMLRTAGSCGNTVRNLTCCALPPRSAAERHLRELAARLARDTLPVGPAFECQPEWLDADSAADLSFPARDVEVSHNRRLATAVLPHKWKIGLAVAGHNCIDVLNNDMAIVVRGDRGRGGKGQRMADVFVGGSTAYQPDRVGSKPRLASWLGGISTADLGDLLAALMEIFQRTVLGERRHFRRWKYVVDRLGVEQIRRELHGDAGRELITLHEPSHAEALRIVDHPRENLQSDGRVAFCVPISGGRIRCEEQVENELRELARLPLSIRVSPQHRLIVADVRDQDLPRVRESLAVIEQAAAARLNRVSEGFVGDEDFRSAGPFPPMQNALACPALPTCPLAVDEAERVLPLWWQVVRDVALEHSLPAPRFALSGCGNGCSRPLTTEIGVVAEKRGKRRVFLGGNGWRLGHSVGTVENLNEFRRLLASWMSRFASSRKENEDFGDWFFRSRK